MTTVHGRFATPSLEPPPNLKGKEFEQLVQHRGDSLAKDGLLCLKRNGVKASHIGDRVVVSKSYPDFTGTMAPDGKRLEIECKVCGGASFKLTAEGKALHTHQTAYLLEKARFGASCWLLIHFNLKVSKLVTHEEFTVGLPVHPNLWMWQAVERGDLKSIKRHEAKEVGVLLPWSYHTERTKTLTPDLRVLLDSNGGES